MYSKRYSKVFYFILFLGIIVLLTYFVGAANTELVNNGNFTDGSSTSWSYSESDPSNVATSNYAASGGSCDVGVWFFKVTDTSPSLSYTVLGNLTNTGNSWSLGTPTSATLTYATKLSWITNAPTTNTVKVYLQKPDSSVVELATRSNTANEGSYTSSQVSVGTGNFTSSGTYNAILNTKVVTPGPTQSTVSDYWDCISLILVPETDAPLLEIQSPTATTYNTNSVDLNYTALDSNSGLSSCWYTLDSGATNTTLSGCSNTTMSSLSEGSNTVIVYANDSAGNLNSSSVTFSVDTVAPILTIVSPTATTYTISTVDFNVSGSESLSSCLFSLDSWATNFTMTQYNTTYYNYTKTEIADASYTANFWCNDSVGNSNTSSVNFVVSTATCDVNLTLSSLLSSVISWSSVDHNTANNTANGNNGAGVTSYNLTVGAFGCNGDVYIKGDGNLVLGGGSIELSNEKVAYSTSDSTVPGTKYALSTDYTDNKILSGASDGTVLHLKFFLDVPNGQNPGTYANSISFKIVKEGDIP